MRVSNALNITAILLSMAASLSAPKAFAQAGPNCEDISRDVSVAIEKDPSKVLMIVEDALVINESCACEIIKAAIVASRADGALVNQIVQTGISVTPKMAGVITDCATSVAPGAAVSQVAPAVSYDKNPVIDKNPIDKTVLPVAPIEEEEEFTVATMRSIYLIQPPPSGFPPRKCHNRPTSPCYCSP